MLDTYEAASRAIIPQIETLRPVFNALGKPGNKRLLKTLAAETFGRDICADAPLCEKTYIARKHANMAARFDRLVGIIHDLTSFSQLAQVELAYVAQGVTPANHDYVLTSQYGRISALTMTTQYTEQEAQAQLNAAQTLAEGLQLHEPGTADALNERLKESWSHRIASYTDEIPLADIGPRRAAIITNLLESRLDFARKCLEMGNLRAAYIGACEGFQNRKIEDDAKDFTREVIVRLSRAAEKHAQFNIGHIGLMRQAQPAAQSLN